MSRARGRAMVIGLVALFVLPLALAYGLYYGAGWHGDGAGAAGHLLRPIVAVTGFRLQPDAPAFVGHWTLLVTCGVPCTSACEQALRAALAKARAVRGLLHVQARRVTTVLLVDDDPSARVPQALQPDVRVYRSDLQDWQRLFTAHHAGRPGTIDLIDPAGRWMAYYPPSIDADGLYHDIRRLLSVADPG